MISYRKNRVYLEKREKVEFIICSNLHALEISEILTIDKKEAKMREP